MTLLFTCVLYRIRRTLKLIQTVTPRRARHVYFKFTFYILIYLICWPLDIAHNVLRYASGNTCHLFALSCIYVGLLNMQGFLNFLVYGFTNKKIYSQFFGKRWDRTGKACIVFFLSPFLLIPIALWAFVRTLRGMMMYGSQGMSTQEIEEHKKLLEARREREERAKRVAQQVQEAESHRTTHHHHQPHHHHLTFPSHLSLVLNDDDDGFDPMTA